MIITFHGKGHIKLVTGDTTIAIAPVSKTSKKRQTKYGSDIALVPLIHPDYDGVDNASNSSKEPFVIKGAGEYEVNNIFINAFSSKINREKVDYMATSFVFNFDGMRIAYIGQIKDLLPSEHKEIIDEVDVLFVPVGGDDLNLNPYDAYKLAVGLEAKIIIPVDHDEKTLPIFLKESGSEKVTAVEKLTIKKKDIFDKKGEVVLVEEM
jgi:L-ascorbate metabolism protein UlaG (beta-lactamase superfamily)